MSQAKWDICHDAECSPSRQSCTFRRSSWHMNVSLHQCSFDKESRVFFFLTFKNKNDPKRVFSVKRWDGSGVYVRRRAFCLDTEGKKTPHVHLQHIIQPTEEKSDRCNLGDYHASLCCECAQSCIHGRENVMVAWKPFITAVRTYTDAQLLEKKHHPAPLENHFNERMFFERKTVGGCDSRGHIFFSPHAGNLTFWFDYYTSWILLREPDIITFTQNWFNFDQFKSTGNSLLP